MRTPLLTLRRQIGIQLLLIVVAVGPGFSRLAQDDASRRTSVILAIEQELLDAVGSGDTAVWRRHLDEDFLQVSEDGSRVTKQALLSSLRPLPKGYAGEIRIIDPKITYVGDEYESVSGQQLHTTYATMNVYHLDKAEWMLRSSQVFEIPRTPPPVRISAAVAASYVGVYALSDSVLYTVSWEKDTLYGSRSGRRKQALLAETENVFFVQDDPRARKLFIRDASGSMRLIARRNGNDVIWHRMR